MKNNNLKILICVLLLPINMFALDGIFYLLDASSYVANIFSFVALYLLVYINYLIFKKCLK